MNRGRVTPERIDDQDVVARLRVPRQREPAIAGDDLGVAARAVVNEGEEARVLGDRLDRRVDLVVRPSLPRLRVTGGFTGAEADAAAPGVFIGLVDGGEHVAKGTQARVVGTGLVLLRRVGQLDAVDGAAIEQEVGRAARVRGE